MQQRWMGPGMALFLALAMMAPGMAKDTKDQGFAGKWTLDKKSSHGSEPLADLRQDIKQNGSEYIIQNRFPEPASSIAPLVYLGIMTTSFRITADGQEVTNQVGPYLVVSRTTLDGNKMTTEWGATINGDQVKGAWVRTLSPDGRRATLEITESSTKGQKGDATLVFNRK